MNKKHTKVTEPSNNQLLASSQDRAVTRSQGGLNLEQLNLQLGFQNRTTVRNRNRSNSTSDTLNVDEDELHRCTSLDEVLKARPGHLQSNFEQTKNRQRLRTPFKRCHS